MAGNASGVRKSRGGGVTWGHFDFFCLGMGATLTETEEAKESSLIGNTTRPTANNGADTVHQHFAFVRFVQSPALGLLDLESKTA